MLKPSYIRIPRALAAALRELGQRDGTNANTVILTALDTFRERGVDALTADAPPAKLWTSYTFQIRPDVEAELRIAAYQLRITYAELVKRAIWHHVEATGILRRSDIERT